MWSPTNIVVTVLRAKGLLTKGKNGTNNCFVTIALGKEKYQTSLKEKATSDVDWHEECELKIPDQGNRAELILTCLHRNNLGIDEFLGQAILPLNEMDVYDRPRSRWFKLESKPGKEKKKERGELEVRISFIVKSGSLTDLRKKEKHKSSIGQLASSVGGSLLSIGTIEKRKSLSKIAKSIGSKMHLQSKKKNKDINDTDSFTGSFSSIETPNSGRSGNNNNNYHHNNGGGRYGQRIGEADPGVISEDEDEFVFDNLSHKSSGSSLNIRSGLQYYTPINPSPQLGKEDENFNSRTLPPSKPPRNAANDSKIDEWEVKLYGKHIDISGTDSLKRRSWETSRVPLPQNTEEETEETESARDLEEAVEDEKLQAKKEKEKKIQNEKDKEKENNFKDIILGNKKISDRENKLQTEVKDNLSTSQIKETNASPKIKQKLRFENILNNSNDQRSNTAPTTPISRRSLEQHEKMNGTNESQITKEETFDIGNEKPTQQTKGMSRSVTMECLSQKDNYQTTAMTAKTSNAITTSIPISSVNNLNLKDKETDSITSIGKEKTDKRNRFIKYKYFNKRDKKDFDHDDDIFGPMSSERMIDHENSLIPRTEISSALVKKYEGKSREELILIAHGMETEALIQRQRVKELEDYLDNLLLRVMETHPKILQNPYSRTTLAKSG